MSKGMKKSPLWELQNRPEKKGNCDKCGEFAELSVEHIFPASLLMMWGLKEQTWLDGENLELLCKKCQILKLNRFDFHHPKTIPLIEKYIEMLKENYKKSTLQTNDTPQ